MKAEKQPIIQLLKTARGQIDGILTMIENDRYCMDVCNQVLATQSVLSKVNREILRAHLNTCVKEAFETDNAEEKIDEILLLMEKLNR